MKVIEILEEDIEIKGEKGNQSDYLTASKITSVVNEGVKMDGKVGGIVVGDERSKCWKGFRAWRHVETRQVSR